MEFRCSPYVGACGAWNLTPSRRLLAAAVGRIPSARGDSTRRSLPQTANASEPNSSRPSGRLIPSNARQRAKALSPIFCGVSGRSAQAGF